MKLSFLAILAFVGLMFVSCDSSSEKSSKTEVMERTTVSSPKSKGKKTSSADSKVSEGVLTDRDWILTGLGGENTSLEAKILFSSAGKQVTGKDGCNVFKGTYLSSDKGKLEWNEDFITSMISCTPEINDGAEQFMKYLMESSSYSVAGSTLSLKNSRGQEVLTFEENAKSK